MYEVLEMSWQAGQQHALYFCKFVVLIVMYSIIINCMSFVHTISPRSLDMDPNADNLQYLFANDYDEPNAV